MKGIKFWLKRILPTQFRVIFLNYKSYKALFYKSLIFFDNILKGKCFFYSVVRKLNLEIRYFTPLKDYIKDCPSDATILREQLINYSFSKPVYWPERRISNIESAIHSQKRHVFNFCLKSVEIFGNSNLMLLDNKIAIYELRYIDTDSKYSYTDGALQYSDRLSCIVKYSGYIRTINKGIKLTANYSWNYYHFMFEVLARFNHVTNTGLSEDIPLIVDKVIFDIPQFKELLDIFNNSKRELIILEKGERVYVKELYVLPDTMICPPNYLKITDVLPEDVLIDLDSLSFLRNTLLQRKRGNYFPKRIFVSRGKASTRRRYNENEVFQILNDYGFVKVYPEEYSATEQAAIFHEADFIIGTTGAAFTNILFCKPTCKVLCLTNYNLPFSGFSTIAALVGLEMLYFHDVSKKVSPKGGLHDAFIVDPKRLHVCLKQWNLANN